MKSLYTFGEIIDKVNSNDYNAEMMLQHLIVRFAELEQERDEARRSAETLILAVPKELRNGFLPWGEGNE